MSDTTTPADDAPPLEYTIELRRSFTYGGGTYSELRLRPPTGGEVRIARQAFAKEVNAVTAYKHDMVLLSKVTGIPEPALDMIDVDQLSEAAEYLNFFTAPSRKTGWKSPQT